MAESKLNLQPVDLTPLIENKDPQAQLACGQLLLKSLREYGVVVTKDSRVPMEMNEEFQKMMENYFNQTWEKKLEDARPQVHYQVGSTPERKEKARDRCSEIAAQSFDANHKPVTVCPPEADLKWRYFWRVGEQPDDSKYTDLNIKNVVPQNFDSRWEKVCNKFGGAILNTSLTIAQGVALAYGLDKNYFAEKMHKAPHLLAPTGSDVSKYGNVGNVYAGYHSDLNFLTTHGKSNFPGLFIWLRDGRRFPVTMPDGCLLTQAGMQIEHMTGGDIFAGMHEVVCYEKTVKAIQRQKDRNRPLWRVSTTLFSHIRSTVTLDIIDQLKTEEKLLKYPPMTAGDHVLEQLRLIGLSADKKGKSEE